MELPTSRSGGRSTVVRRGVAASTSLEPAEATVDGVSFRIARGEMVGEWVGNWINETLGGEAEIASLTADFHETGRQRIGGAEKLIMELAPNAKVVNRTEAVLAPEAFTATLGCLA